VRSDPKGQMEGDLSIAAVGLLIIVFGGIAAVAGFHSRVQSIHDNTPAPLAGNIIAVVGALVVLLGFGLAAVNLVIWMTGRRQEGPTASESENEALLQTIRDDGRNRPL
jgi:formate hydrogenlyase subunit 3/multisubunit Na+/H+ antiporter MnhD subunit